MAVLITNDGADDYLLPDRRTIPVGESIVLSDEELRLIPDSRRGTGKLLISAVSGSISIAPEPKYIVEIDDAGGGVTYIGEAAPTSAHGDAAWRIQKLTETAGDMSLRWADGNEDFDNVWTNRAGLSYS